MNRDREDKRPTNPDGLRPPRPEPRPQAPGVPGMNLPPRDAARELVRDAVASVRPEPPATPVPVERRRLSTPEGTQAPAESEGPKSQSVGFAIKISNPVAWTALIVAVFGAAGAFWAKVDAARPARVEAVAVNQDASDERVKTLEQGHADEVKRLNETIRALACRLDVQSSALRRQGYDPGFGEDVAWLSQYLPDDRRVRKAPAWVTNKSCPALPKVPDQ